MNSLDYYIRQKEKWSDVESSQLLKEYCNDNMNISQIGDIHKKTPGSIAYKLRQMGIINTNTEARGYDSYKNSNLYNEIVTKGRENDAKKRQDTITNHNNNVTYMQPVMISIKEFVELQQDVKQLKNDMKELLKTMELIVMHNMHIIPNSII
jgi:hypothetical protein